VVLSVWVPSPSLAEQRQSRFVKDNSTPTNQIYRSQLIITPIQTMVSFAKNNGGSRSFYEKIFSIGVCEKNFVFESASSFNFLFLVQVCF
jgi:hypothetical protein